MRHVQHGYSYLAVLFLVALTAAGLAALGQAWSTAAQREKERELEFRGKAIANAIASYQRAGRAADLPRSLDDLVEDRRSGTVRRHLRQRYLDPFTQAPDWELVGPPTGVSSERSPQGQMGFHAVRSRSEQPLLRESAGDGTVIHKAKDWLFSASSLNGAAPVAAAPASGASAAGSAPGT